VSLKDTPVRGDTNAPVVLIEFADYECPYCQQVEPTLSKLAEQYKGKLLIAYKDTPLPMHPHAPQAAEAAHCAGAQGKYWEYHDLLLANKQLEIAELKQDARTLKLDGAAFDKCLDEGAMRSIVKAHVAEAVAVGVQGTPSFLINGRFLTGNVSYDTLRGIVDEELAAAKQKQQQIARR
jgi:protein-disulfide isomerase